MFDISAPTPQQLQAIPVPNTFSGIAWAPDGKSFYVAGGQDDNIHTYKVAGGVWAETGTPVAFHHTEFGVPQPAGNGLFSLPGFGAAVSPLAAGVGVTADGHKVIVANLENDSISVIDLTNGNALSELDLRPGRNDPTRSGVPGGEFPFWVAVKGSDTVYVSSERDREIVVVNLNVLRTIEDVLGLEHLSLHDAGVPPMSALFAPEQGPGWTYKAVPSQFLLGTQLPLQMQARLDSQIPRPLHDADWWAQKTRGFTFTREDLNDAAAYNRVLWEGTMGARPYPVTRSGRDLRHHRRKLLKRTAAGAT